MCNRKGDYRIKLEGYYDPVEEATRAGMEIETRDRDDGTICLTCIVHSALSTLVGGVVQEAKKQDEVENVLYAIIKGVLDGLDGEGISIVGASIERNENHEADSKEKEIEGIVELLKKHFRK